MSPKFLFICGATASGKSDLAIQIAKKFSGEIINCDSVQVYKHVQIGAAKPSVDEMKIVSHHLYDYVDFPNEKTAGEFRKDFLQLVRHANKNTFYLVVGGTGFYFQALEKGMFESITVPKDLRETIETELAQPLGRERLHQELMEQDPLSAAKIHPSDSYRLVRAIEVIRFTGKSWSEIQAKFESESEGKAFPWPLLKLRVTWPRDQLRKRIALRTEQMLQRGLVTEVQELLAKGFANPGQEWAPLKSVGYKECVDYLRGPRDPAKISHLRDEIVLRTSQLAKRQETWFKRDKEMIDVPTAVFSSALEKQVAEFLD